MNNNVNRNVRMVSKQQNRMTIYYKPG